MSNRTATIWMITATATEARAIEAYNALSRKIRGDSQYWITDEDRATRAAGEDARKTAIARMRSWDTLWNAANTDEERKAIEIAAEVSERGMVYIATRA